VRGALTPELGFSNVKTDFGTTTVTFQFSKSDADLTAILDELAKTNSHIAEWKRKP
jgi:hypothetical protein